MNTPTDMCFTCFLTGHKSANCQHQWRQVRNPKFAAWVLGNYNRLAQDQRAYLLSIGCVPVEILLEEAHKAGREAGRAENAQVGPPPAERESPVGVISLDAAPGGFRLKNMTKPRRRRKTTRVGGALNDFCHRDPP